jgi:Tfp pilus assembly ATPase PilU
MMPCEPSVCFIITVVSPSLQPDNQTTRQTSSTATTATATATTTTTTQQQQQQQHNNNNDANNNSLSRDGIQYPLAAFAKFTDLDLSTSVRSITP